MLSASSARRLARRDGMARIGEQIDEHQAQPFRVRDDGRQRAIEAHGGGERLTILAARLERVGAERVEIGRRDVEADRLGEVEHFADDAVEADDLFVDVGDRGLDVGRREIVPAQPAQGRLDDHQRVANLVRDDGREPSQ